jgi:hypothetical protein
MTDRVEETIIWLDRLDRLEMSGKTATIREIARRHIADYYAKRRRPVPGESYLAWLERVEASGRSATIREIARQELAGYRADRRRRELWTVAIEHGWFQPSTRLIIQVG